MDADHNNTNAAAEPSFTEETPTGGGSINISISISIPATLAQFRKPLGDPIMCLSSPVLISGACWPRDCRDKVTETTLTGKPAFVEKMLMYINMFLIFSITMTAHMV